MWVPLFYDVELSDKPWGKTCCAGDVRAAFIAGKRKPARLIAAGLNPSFGRVEETIHGMATHSRCQSVKGPISCRTSLSLNTRLRCRLFTRCRLNDTFLLTSRICNRDVIAAYTGKNRPKLPTIGRLDERMIESRFRSMVPPSLVYFAALFRILASTCTIRFRSRRITAISRVVRSGGIVMYASTVIPVQWHRRLGQYQPACRST